MNPSNVRRLARAVGLSLLVWASSAGAQQEKIVHLRNERIVTSPANRGTNKHSEKSTSGLYIIQFAGPFQSEWRSELETQGITFLRYVPEDAFVVRLKNASLETIDAFDFVRWVGPFRPEHKLHKPIDRNRGPNDQLETDVKVLLATDVDQADIAQVRRLFGSVKSDAPTRFGHIVQGRATDIQLAALAESPAVLWIEHAPTMKLYDEIASKIVGGDDGSPGTPTITQQLGFNGSGVTVAVADSGLQEGDNATMHPDLAGRVDAYFAYGSLTDAADEHSHGTHVTGIIAGNASTGEVDENGFRYGLGVAPGAHVIAQRIFDGVGNYEAPPGFEVLTHDAVRAGAKVGSNSWGDDTQGRYDLSAAEFDALVRDADTGTAGDQPYILEFSAGNAGPGVQTIGSPAVAKNVIATGAVENNRFDLFIYDSGQDTMADFSSRGPCEDGRIKPDVVAPGTWIASLRSSLADDNNAWADISENYLYQGGTSQSGPHVSGAAAVFVQYYGQTVTNTTPSPALVKAALINSSIDMDDEAGDTGPVPNNDEGWGLVDLTELIDSPRRFEFVDQSIPLTNNQVFSRTVLVGSTDEALKITLTYTDVPGFPAAIPALVNDLDLEVIAPNGDVFRGNQFEAGESVPNAPSFDTINNVEAVHISTPVPGEYVVRVRARNVVEDAVRSTPRIDQDFALVISADIPEPGSGVVFFDRQAYSAPDSIQVKLIDYNLAGQSSATVKLSSASEAGGENFLLTANGNTGAFTGKVATAIGGTIADGRLQVAHNDWIEARYLDAAPSGVRIATARADLLPPVITNVSATNRFGKTVFAWQTDEPANSIVRYGTNTVPSTSGTNRTLTLQHEVEVDGLIAGKTYRFFVASTDEAGNSATNNNNGALFTVIPQSASTVLLVDAYTAVPTDYGPTIPITSYTDALDQTGVSYEIWNTSQRGFPTTNNLTPFRVVIWRINDNVFSDNTLTTSQQNTLKAYIDSGGSLFISSMELISRIGTTGTALAFRSNVLHISNFVEDAMVPAIDGIDNDPITSGISLDLDYSKYNSDILELFGVDPDVADTITPTTNATTICFEAFSGRVAGVRYPRTGEDSVGRTVFLPFPLDAISTSDADPNNRANFLRNVLNFLAPGVNGLGTVVLNNSIYTIPSQVVVEVADSDLAGLGQAHVSLYSDTATNAQSITLNETTRRGLFRGFITLVAANKPPAPGELRVHHGDTFAIEYFDASANGIVRVSATVDTVPPTITGTTASPEYEEATISWSTSKDADSSIQFGESLFLGRTAYDPELTTDHSVIVSGLSPDHVYFYRVVSRDLAGNTVIDDNNGSMYSFRTLRPLSTPWTDSLETSRTNWVVLDGEPGTTWQLGTPNNGMESEAHSPTNAWASNLNGNFIDVGDTTLASPAIDLSGGTRATLHFWQSYDFTSQSESDIYEFGQVYVSTNNGNAWVQLAEFAESSFGWEEASIDLSAYVGHVVRVGFYYGLFTLEAANHPGWIIDDVSIEVSNGSSPLQFSSIAITNGQTNLKFTAPSGTTYVLEVSNNLSNWTPLQTNVTTAAESTYIDSFSPSNAPRFYRLRE